MHGYHEPTVILNNLDLLPGNCEESGCDEPARYTPATAGGGYYCPKHLIECLDKAGIRPGGIVYRVPVFEC